MQVRCNHFVCASYRPIRTKLSPIGQSFVTSVTSRVTSAPHFSRVNSADRVGDFEKGSPISPRHKDLRGGIWLNENSISDHFRKLRFADSIWRRAVRLSRCASTPRKLHEFGNDGCDEHLAASVIIKRALAVSRWFKVRFFAPFLTRSLRPRGTVIFVNYGFDLECDVFLSCTTIKNVIFSTRHKSRRSVDESSGMCET